MLRDRLCARRRRQGRDQVSGASAPTGVCWRHDHQVSLSQVAQKAPQIVKQHVGCDVVLVEERRIEVAHAPRIRAGLRRPRGSIGAPAGQDGQRRHPEDAQVHPDAPIGDVAAIYLLEPLDAAV
jgi:hypothetical protein